MLSKLSIPGAMCLALAAAKPLNVDDTTDVGMRIPTSAPQLSELDPASRVPVTTTTGVVPEVEARKSLSLATKHRSSLERPTPPAPTPASDARTTAVAAESARITVLNRHDVAITTVLVTGEGEEPEGNVGAGKLNRGQYGIFTVVKGWSGRVAVNVEGGSVTMGDESLIEGSFTDQGHGVVGDINVSYVDGFSLPALCWCNQNRRSAGCAKDLWSLGNCPSPNGHGSCRNPSRGQNASAPAAFFKPCFYRGGAYTFDWDHEANSLNGLCPDEQYTCCVGDICHV
ncbi:hypothetical protein MY11210_005542 [Beauveria gryllotalpidicola]